MKTISFQQAARELRAHLGYSQQRMATELQMSMGAVRNYESGAVEPTPRALAAYLWEAKWRHLGALENLFRSRLQEALGKPLWSLVRPSKQCAAITREKLQDLYANYGN
jgi:transcriptional regulator with XRE-family HTH domain